MRLGVIRAAPAKSPSPLNTWNPLIPLSEAAVQFMLTALAPVTLALKVDIVTNSAPSFSNPQITGTRPLATHCPNTQSAFSVFQPSFQLSGLSVASARIVKFVHPVNAQLPIDITLLGMMMDVKPVQSRNAEPPICVTLFGMVMEVKLVQPANAMLPICVTLFGMVTDVKPVQLSNTEVPINVTLLGIVIEVNAVL